MTDDFDDLRLRDFHFFDRLAVLGSVTKAARAVHVPKATASRWLANLEVRVGQSLVRRTTRSVALTDAGKAFHAHVKEILSVAEAARQAAQSTTPGGTVRVSVPVPLGRLVAGPVIAAFRARLPSVRLEIKLQNDRVDLIKDGFDVAIRGGPLEDSELIARKLSAASMWLYASARFRDDDTASIPIIGSPGDDVLLRRARVDVAQGPPAVLVDDRSAVADALVWGAGAGLLPSFLGEGPRRQGALIRLDDAPVTALPVHAVFHPAQRHDVRVRVLVDEIAKQLETVL